MKVVLKFKLKKGIGMKITLFFPCSNSPTIHFSYKYRFDDLFLSELVHKMEVQDEEVTRHR